MELLDLEALIALIEHCSAESYPLPKCCEAALASVGADLNISRKLVPDVVPSSSVLQLLAGFSSIPKAVPPQSIVSAMVTARDGGSGFGIDKMVPLETLMALIALMCSASMHERIQLAFWVLDRDARGYVTLQQILHAVEPLLRVAEVAKIMLQPGGARPATSVTAQQPSARTHRRSHSRSGSDVGFDRSREILRGGLTRAFSEQDVQGRQRLYAPQLLQLVLSAATHIASIMMQHTSSSSFEGATPPLYQPQMSDSRSACSMGGGGRSAFRANASPPTDLGSAFAAAALTAHDLSQLPAQQQRQQQLGKNLSSRAVLSSPGAASQGVVGQAARARSPSALNSEPNTAPQLHNAINTATSATASTSAGPPPAHQTDEHAKAPPPDGGRAKPCGVGAVGVVWSRSSSLGTLFDSVVASVVGKAHFPPFSRPHLSDIDETTPGPQAPHVAIHVDPGEPLSTVPRPPFPSSSIQMDGLASLPAGVSASTWTAGVVGAVANSSTNNASAANSRERSPADGEVAKALPARCEITTLDEDAEYANRSSPSLIRQSSLDTALQRAEQFQVDSRQAGGSTLPGKTRGRSGGQLPVGSRSQLKSSAKGAARSIAGAAAGAGGMTLKAAISNSVHDAAVKIFLNCGICLLAIITVLLADAGFVLFLTLETKCSLAQSLGIVAASDIFAIFVLLSVLVIRTIMASNRAAKAISSPHASNGGGGHPADGMLGMVLSPLLKMFQGQGQHDTQRGATEGPGASNLRKVWSTIGRVAGFDNVHHASFADGRNSRMSRMSNEHEQQSTDVGNHHRHADDDSHAGEGGHGLPSPTNEQNRVSEAVQRAYGDFDR